MAWICAAVGVVALASVLRLTGLDLRPFHGDEAVNAYKFHQLDTGTGYHYDPTEYHGPLLEELTEAVAWVRGFDYGAADEAWYRQITAVAGIGVVVLTLGLRRGIGAGAALGAGVLVATSPAMTFYSRYYIHEMLLVLFTAALVLCGRRYFLAARERRGDLAWAAACGACVGLMHATKETFVLTIVAAGVGLGVVWVWRGGTHAASGVAKRGEERRGSWVAGVLVAVGVSVVLFSQFFTDFGGVVDSVRTYGAWVMRGAGEAGGLHVHPWWYYLGMLIYSKPAAGPWWSEGLIVGLAAVGAVAGVTGWGVKREHRGTARFFVGFTVALVVMYSAIPYKTPWCLVSFLWGMTVLGGIGAVALGRGAAKAAGGGCGGWAAACVVVGVLGAAAWQLGGQDYRANFVFHTDRRNPYVYAHPTRDVRRLADRVVALAKLSGVTDHASVCVIDDGNVWPLPWYLRNVRVNWLTRVPDAVRWPLLVVRSEMVKELRPLVGDAEGYEVESRGLRPTEVLVLYVPRGLWAKYMASRGGSAIGAAGGR